jgi:SAM-dependent methyltransferase
MSQPHAADYLSLNRTGWEQRVPYHVASRFYGVDAFLEGACTLPAVDLEEVGAVEGRSLLHLQCHFGLDTLSWARRGAQVTGLDFSPSAVAQARSLAQRAGLGARFVCANVYDAFEALGLDQDGAQGFDLVYTSYGVLGWLPDLKPWAKAAASCLKPGGVLHLIEFHPVVWMFDDNLQEIAYPYDSAEPIETVNTGTYADRDAPITLREMNWDHGLGTVVSAVLGAGLVLEGLREFAYSPYDIFPGSREVAPGKFQVERWGDRVPMFYALRARKPG